MAPALCVSPAAMTTENPAFFRKFANFATVVVFPVPFIPRKRILKGSPWAFFSLILSRTSTSPAWEKTESTSLLSFSFTSSCMSLERSTDIPRSCFFKSPVTFSTMLWATSLSISASWKLERDSSRSFSDSFLSDTAFAREENAPLSFSNIT